VRKVVLVAALVSGGCPTDTGNPFASEMRLHAHSSDVPRVAVLADGSLARVDQVWIGAGSITPLGDDCATRLDTQPAATPAIRDLAQPGAQDVVVELLEQPLCAIAIPLVQVAAAPTAAPLLAGHSVLVLGVRTSDDVAFRIRTALTGQVFMPELVPGVHFTITEDQPATFLGFDVATWITGGVDLATAVPTGSGAIEIEAGLDDVRLAAFEANLAAGFELYDDPDASGSASTGEAKLAKGTQLRL
jgi:hypothetical protein